MYINITTSEIGNNKGSSGALVHYLEKENAHIQNLHLQERWFNGKDASIKPHQVRIGIDNNVAKLGKDDRKFFLINISPSQKELTYLIDTYGKHIAKEKLKEFAVKVMDEYAVNFKRPGINTNQDLMWFGKLENHRYYGYQDKEVKSGIKKRGDQKEGVQMHVQVIVSRKDVTNLIKLSPQNTSRGKNKSHSVKLGQFDRLAFKESGERLFDEHFGFQRNLKESIQYANTMKNGTPVQQAQLHSLHKLQEKHVPTQGMDQIDELLTAIQREDFKEMADFFTSIGSVSFGLFSAFSELEYNPEDESTLTDEEKKRKRRNKYKDRRL